MKKALVTVLVLAVVGAGGYGAYHHFFADKAGSEGRVSSTSEDAVYVDSVAQIAGLGSGNGLIERYGGVIEPQATLEVKLEGERTVKECLVKEGDVVKEGQELFVYDTQEDEDKLAQAEIDIERSKSDIELSEQSIAQLEKEKNSANADDRLVITTQILTEQNDIKRSEYEIKKNELTIEQLKDTIENATVTAEMAGTVQKISDPNSTDSSSYGYYSGSSDSGSTYITILADGDYRVKGSLNEQNYNQLQTGMPVIVYSRVDNSLTWTGTVSEIKDSADEESDQEMYYSYGMDSDSGSSNYTFYVELESSEGLMLGQHVYMEPDSGQNDVKEGLWIEDYYIMQEDDKAYVWMANQSNVIEKHEVTLGEYDDELFKYEITDGLTEEDYIAYPLDTISEGNPVIYNEYSDTGSMLPSGTDMSVEELSGMDGEVLEGEYDEELMDMEYEDEYFDEGMLEDEYTDEDMLEDEYTDEDMLEDEYTDEGMLEDEYADAEVYDADADFSVGEAGMASDESIMIE